MNKFDDDKFSMTNVSLLDENISSPRNITSSPAPISANQRRSSNNRRFSTLIADEVGNGEYDSRPISTSLKTQESVGILTKIKKKISKNILKHNFVLSLLDPRCIKEGKL